MHISDLEKSWFSQVDEITAAPGNALGQSP
jgi:hypothetical protein